MNRIDLTKLAGFPGGQKTFKFLQDNYSDGLGAIAKFIGNKKIITGVENVGGIVSDGWVVIDGELLFFQGGAVGTKIIVVETADVTPVTFADGSTQNVYFTRKATFGTGVGEFLYSELTRLQPLEEVWQEKDIKHVSCDAAYILANFEASGLGKNLRKGWAIANGANGTDDWRGQFMVAYDDRSVDPANGIWDILYNTPGATGGEKAHTLTTSEMPSHQHTTHGEGAIAGNRYLSRNNNRYSQGSGADAFGSDTVIDAGLKTGATGGGAAHENRPNFKVIVVIQKINIQ
jgi:hypothetical protein